MIIYPYFSWKDNQQIFVDGNKIQVPVIWHTGTMIVAIYHS